MTPERRSQLRLSVDELKRTIERCLDEKHESKTIIAQMESTIASIEQKKRASQPFKVNPVIESFAPPIVGSMIQETPGTIS